MAFYLPHEILHNQFLVTAHRCLYWENEKTLVLSDLHLGKTGHFRKSGIGIPQTVMKEDMLRLIAAIQYYQPKRLIIIGDLFHSYFNKEHNFFLKWRKDLLQINIILVKGNHDILENSWYEDAGIQVADKLFITPDFIFAHDVNDCPADSNKYCFSGHIHPGIRIKGRGKQHVQLPCFHFGKAYAILPAFGLFTGTHAIESVKGDVVFALVENGVMRVS